MPCIVCNHTVQSVGRNEDGFRQFWCPRCGAIKSEGGGHEFWEAPRWMRMLQEDSLGHLLAEVYDAKQAQANSQA